jgi:hypothetical protein
MCENGSLKRPDKRSWTLTDGCRGPNVSQGFRLHGGAMKRNGTSHKLLLAGWLLFCGFAVGGLFFLIELTAGPPYDSMLPILVGIAAIPFVWMLSSGWIEADLFRKALRGYTGDDQAHNP